MKSKVDRLNQERYQAAQQDRATAQQERAAAQAEKEAESQRAAQLKIEREHARIAREKQQVMALLGAGGRFAVAQGEVVKDQRTGRMWALLDSRSDSGQCMDYRTAVDYVHGLQWGGYRDWRLPTSGELAGIYKNSPYFPYTGVPWYWTSESFYKGYHEQANIVTSKREAGFRKESVKTDSCGDVRATRP